MCEMPWFLRVSRGRGPVIRTVRPHKGRGSKHWVFAAGGRRPVRGSGGALPAPEAMLAPPRPCCQPWLPHRASSRGHSGVCHCAHWALNTTRGMWRKPASCVSSRAPSRRAAGQKIPSPPRIGAQPRYWLLQTSWPAARHHVARLFGPLAFERICRARGADRCRARVPQVVTPARGT